jgi:predicted glycosyltransferase
LWHGDQAFLPFDFPLVARLRPQILPTGYVRVGSSPPWQPQHRHWVASCGSGRGDGLRYCLGVLDAQRQLALTGWRLTLVCGRETWQQFQALPHALPEQATLLPWTDDLPTLLATAAVTVSQGGYNTVLEVVASGAPGVFIPYVKPRNVEQAMRTAALARFPGYLVLPQDDPALGIRLAEAVSGLERVRSEPPALALDGAATSARLLAELKK